MTCSRFLGEKNGTLQVLPEWALLGAVVWAGAHLGAVVWGPEGQGGLGSGWAAEGGAGWAAAEGGWAARLGWDLREECPPRGVDPLGGGAWVLPRI